MTCYRLNVASFDSSSPIDKQLLVFDSLNLRLLPDETIFKIPYSPNSLQIFKFRVCQKYGVPLLSE